jgi:hypothetical protein
LRLANYAKHPTWSILKILTYEIREWGERGATKLADSEARAKLELIIDAKMVLPSGTDQDD